MTWSDWQDQRSYLAYLVTETARAYADAHVTGTLSPLEVEPYLEARAALLEHDAKMPALA